MFVAGNMFLVCVPGVASLDPAASLEGVPCALRGRWGLPAREIKADQRADSQLHTLTRDLCRGGGAETEPITHD